MSLDVQFTVTGLSVEKLLNQAFRSGVILQQVKRRPGRSLTLRCKAAVYPLVRSWAEEKGYQISDPKPTGLLRILERIKARWSLAAAGLVCAALMVYALGFVWQVRVENAGAYEGEVRAFLKDAGIVPGIRRSRVRLDEVREKLEWFLPRVKWVRADWQGVALRVSLEEGTPPPDIETEGPCGDVVADRDGLLTRLVTYAGTPRAKAGDFVRAGQVLIEGIERGKNGENTPVKARGEALARVWTAARVRLPLTDCQTQPTGRETRRRVIVTPFFSYSARETPDYLTWDFQESRSVIGGVWFPVLLKKETYAEARLEMGQRDAETVAREAEEAAMRLLDERLKNAETVDKWINFRMIEGDTIVVEAAGETLVSIGRCRKTGGQ